MSIAVSPLKLKGAIRQEVLAQIQTQIRQAVCQNVTSLLNAFFEGEIEAKLGRAKYQPRPLTNQPRLIEWHCAGCGSADANQFSRDGHYQRTLETEYGHLRGLRIPMLECQQCHHDVVCHYAILAKWQRFWADFEQKVVYGSAVGQSLRQMRDQWSAQLGGSVGLRTINERINQLEVLASQSRQSPLRAVPPVVQFDGIWLNLSQSSPTLKPDKAGRMRHQRRGVRRVLLVALGLWADGSGRREILDWEIAESENQASWEKLLQRLWERGLRAENGLKLILRDGGAGLGEAFDYIYSGEVIEQGCIFHKLRNLRQNFKGGVSRKSDPKGYAERKECQATILKEAAQIYEGASAVEARERLKEWVAKWSKSEPKAVELFELDFEQTLGYYQLEGVGRELVRTTSLLERVNRELRRKLRQVDSFGSEVGAEVGVYLQVRRLNAKWSGENWWEVSQQICFERLELNP